MEYETVCLRYRFMKQAGDKSAMKNMVLRLINRLLTQAVFSWKSSMGISRRRERGEQVASKAVKRMINRELSDAVLVWCRGLQNARAMSRSLITMRRAAVRILHQDYSFSLVSWRGNVLSDKSTQNEDVSSKMRERGLQVMNRALIRVKHRMLSDAVLDWGRKQRKTKAFGKGQRALKRSLLKMVHGDKSSAFVTWRRKYTDAVGKAWNEIYKQLRMTIESLEMKIAMTHKGGQAKAMTRLVKCFRNKDAAAVILAWHAAVGATNAQRRSSRIMRRVVLRLKHQAQSRVIFEWVRRSRRDKKINRGDGIMRRISGRLLHGSLVAALVEWHQKCRAGGNRACVKKLRLLQIDYDAAVSKCKQVQRDHAVLQLKYACSKQGKGIAAWYRNYKGDLAAVWEKKAMQLQAELSRTRNKAAAKDNNNPHRSYAFNT